ncbi:UNVERIFIED_CONTAM: YigZ family protein [Kocuria sp. CPCC 205295]|uniref:Protein co-occurring with transport system n=1 Tax=Kocuria palustris PEL TaxID=1236550 RepID=M2WH11_9MICC|nr:YigZ family protein [Kocuria palustris]EME37862.1 protein co-occurring with transport system [Kocuria palustris PEL]
MPQRYTVLAHHREISHEIEIKRSRFLCVLRRVQSEDEARELIAELRRRHHDARHHCSAFVLGADRMIQRSNDDGEPSGTAGAPMLEALTQHRSPPSPEAAHDAGAEEQPELSDVCAVVVRWFGGTLLGAGGLVRAYSQAVTETLDSAPTLVRERRRHLSVAVSPAFAGKVDNELRASGIAVLDTDYGASEAVLHTGVPDRDDAVEHLRAVVSEVTSGQGRIDDGGTGWVDLA